MRFVGKESKTPPTLRFDLAEKNKMPLISDKFILNQSFKITPLIWGIEI